MILITHHRTFALAQRKAVQLRRKYASVELLSRRNAAGRYSSRGTSYVWEVQAKKKKAKRAEFVVHFDYGTLSKKKGDQRIRFQVHVFGPANATITDAIRAIRQRNDGGPWPKEWSKRAIFWGKPKGDAQVCVHRTDPISPDLRKTTIGGGTTSPAPHCALGKVGGKRK